jgi:undecaprenyl-diphosphatase
MTIVEGTALGLLQGIAEFLPISSSGHLAVAKRLFGLGEVPILYDIALHVATLAAVVIVFRKRIAALLVSLGRWIMRSSHGEDAENLRFILAVIVATFFTGIIGLGIEKLHPEENLKVVSIGFIVTAFILVVSERLGVRAASRGAGRVPGLREGAIVGIAQGIGVLPGVSRSGITISASLAAGVGREKAGEFSFILSIPAILGAFALELKDAGNLASRVELLPLVTGLVVAFASGILAIKLLLGLVRRGKLSWFAIYLVPLGIAGLLLL